MKLAETKKISIAGETFLIRKSNRAIIDYEQLTGKMEIDNFQEGLVWLFATARAGAKAEKKEFPYQSFDQFLDAIDDDTMASVKFSDVVEQGEKKKMMMIRPFISLVIYTVIVLGLWELIRFIFWIT